MADPLLDRAHLDAQTFGDRALAREVLALFVAQCRRLVPLILDGAAAERADLAHTLKGAALGVGAIRVAGLSAAVEASLRAGAADPDALATLALAAEATVAEIGDEGDPG